MQKNILLLIFSILTAFNLLELTKGSSFPISKGNKSSTGVHLSGFVTSQYFDKQICMFNYDPEIRILVNV